MTEDRTRYPVRVDAALDGSVSRWLWLVKWLLLIPHAIVLFFLWLAFAVLSVVAFFAILITARYPRALFEFNVGVLRWTWRVHYYGYGALGTDRYPPFTLADVPDYPARLEVPYPERLSRGLVLVKWWLLAIPHYIVVAVFIGGGAWMATRSGRQGWEYGWGTGGLVGLLVLVAAIVLLFSGAYPRPIYDFVLGMDRWVLRVAAYVGLMTDRYPPFRLDMGGTDPGSVPVLLPPPPPPSAWSTSPPVSPGAPPTGSPMAYGGAVPPTRPGGPAQPAGAGGRGWTTGRIVSVVIGALLLLLATAPLIGGGALLWADRTQRNGGYLQTPRAALATSGYAITSEDVRLDVQGEQWVLDRFVGAARIQATPAGGTGALFVGIAPTADVDRYLSGVGHAVVTDVGWRWNGDLARPGQIRSVAGGAPTMPPGDAGFWRASVSGTGTQVLNWKPTSGNWTVVVMRADAGAGVRAHLRLAVTAPSLGWVAGGLIAVGVVLAVAGALLVALAVHRVSRASGSGPGGGGSPAVPPTAPSPVPGAAEPALTGPAAPPR